MCRMFCTYVWERGQCSEGRVQKYQTRLFHNIAQKKAAPRIKQSRECCDMDEIKTLSKC